jgi:hypothetical protein
MSDLTSLMDMSPGVGAFYIGQNQANNVAQDQLRQQELAQIIQKYQIANQQDQAMNPLKLTEQGLMNQGLQADLPGKVAKAQQEQTTATKGQATLESDIAAAKSNNAETVSKNQYSDYVRARDVMLQAGPMLANVPAPMRAQAFLDHIKANHMDPNSPSIQQFIAQAQRDPAGFPQYIAGVADKLGAQAVAMNPEARVQQEGHRLSAGATVEAAKLHSNATVEAARIGAQGRVDAVFARQQVANDIDQDFLHGKNTAEQSATKASYLAQKALRANNNDDYQYFQAMANRYEKLAMQLKDAQHNGQMGLGQNPDGSVGLTPHTINPALGEGLPPVNQAVPKTGKTKSGANFTIVPK